MTENIVSVYWPGPEFEYLHHGRKFKIANGDNAVVASLATRLKQRFALKGLVDVPEDAELATRVRKAADARNAHAAVPRVIPALRNSPGAKLEDQAPVEVAPVPDAEPPAPAPPKPGRGKAKAEA